MADITYIPTWAGLPYLAVVLDAFSRKIVGWAMESYPRTELVLKALQALAVSKYCSRYSGPDAIPDP